MNYSLAVSNFTYPESLTTKVPVQENATYTCRIAAGNVAGLGPYSDPQQVSIRRIVLVTESDDRGSVHITWTTPQIVPGVNQISSIKCQYGLYRGMSSNIMYTDVPGVTQPSVLLTELGEAIHFTMYASMYVHMYVCTYMVGSCIDRNVFNGSVYCVIESIFSFTVNGKPYKVLVTVDISFVRIIASKILFSKEIGKYSVSDHHIHEQMKTFYISSCVFCLTAPAVTVEDFSVITLNGTSVLLSWKPLTLEQAGGFPIYRVSLRSDGGAPVVLEINDSLVIISNLTPGLKYEIQMNAVTKGGEGPLLKGEE